MLYKDNKKDAELQASKSLKAMSYCDLVEIGEDWRSYLIKSMQNFNISEPKFFLNSYQTL